MSAQLWEERFSSWASPPGETETQKIENVITAIRDALRNDQFLTNNTKVFVQGSYRNRVNVRQESDVDVGVLYTGNSFFCEYPAGMTDSHFSNIDGNLNYYDFKSLIHAALVKKFGETSVTRGNKAFDIHANTYRVDADVVPLFVHRRYRVDGSYICGVQLCSDAGEPIVNWPERLYEENYWPNQHYENGVGKNTDTGRRYKGVVRILKKLKFVMIERGVKSANDLPGFFIECLVWNTPNARFRGDSWYESVQGVLAHIWSSTKEFENCCEWGEVSELKYLFKGSPDSKRIQAHTFINDAWDLIGVG